MAMPAPDIHHKILYGGMVLILAVLAFGWRELSKTATIDDVPAVYHADASCLAKIPFGKHEYDIAAAPDTGALPAEITSSINSGGGSFSLDWSSPIEGIHIGPKNSESINIAAALSDCVGDKVDVFEESDKSPTGSTEWEIIIGSPKRKHTN